MSSYFSLLVMKDFSTSYQIVWLVKPGVSFLSRFELSCAGPLSSGAAEADTAASRMPTSATGQPGRTARFTMPETRAG